MLSQKDFSGKGVNITWNYSIQILKFLTSIVDFEQVNAGGGLYYIKHDTIQPDLDALFINQSHLRVKDFWDLS